MNLLWAIVKFSVKNLWAHKMRSFLTTLGIMIGVAAVIAIMSLTEGAKDAMISQIRSFGTNVITIIPNYRSESGVVSANIQELSLDDCKALLDEVPELHSLSPEITRDVQIKFGNQNLRTTIRGVASPYLEIRNYELEAGRNFNASEEEFRKKVAILGYKIVAEFFDRDPHRAIGQEIKISGTAYTIIGTTKEKGTQGFMNPDDQILIPFTTAMSRITGSTNLQMLNLKIVSEDKIEDAIRGVTRTLRRMHRLTEDKEDDFRIYSSTDAIETFETMGRIFTLLLAGIASVSLLVGGIGIMNIMLVTVTERTREIGIRKALGAKRRDIMRQFLIESVIISLLGGALGVSLGLAFAAVADSFEVINTVVSIKSLVMSLGFCLFIGIFFGIYPARKASRLDPIEALRYE